MKKEENKADIVEVEVKKTYCKDLQNKFLLVRVGNDQRPAEEKDMQQVREELDRIFDENGIDCLLFVTHHAISLDIIEKRGI